jgi:signal peptidase I
MDGAASPKRGEILIFSVGGMTYIQRVAAVAGDSIAMKDGIVVLNGRPVAQRFLKEEERRGLYGAVRARRLVEQFPGEAAGHEILDQGPTPLDDLEDMRIPPGFLFMLGDNRDMSADSRVPHEAMGVELLPLADVRGRPLVRTWPSSKAGDRFR